MSDEKVSSAYEQTRTSCRLAIRGKKQLVVSGHHLATQAAMRILDQGGNAVDAAAAAGICLSVLQSDMVNFAGVAPEMSFTGGRLPRRSSPSMRLMTGCCRRRIWRLTPAAKKTRSVSNLASIPSKAPASGARARYCCRL